MGRTWDESAYVEQGYVFIDLIRQGNFTDPFWYNNFDHPPLARYLYGSASFLDLAGYDKNGKPIFHYDYTHARLVSALLTSLSAVLIAALGWRYISAFVGTSAGIILSMLPLSVGYGQIATLESFILFFFTAAAYAFITFLENKSLKNIVITGILLGMALEVKQSNILLVPLFLLMFAVWYIYEKKTKEKQLFEKKIFYIFFIGLLTYFAIWPMPWFHLSEVISFHNNMWLTQNPLPPPEVFFGKMILVPKIYYVVFFFITTPLFILILSLFGLRFISDKKRWVFYIIVLWFLFPFIQSLYHFRQHGIRYIIEIYAPFALIAGIGCEFLAEKLHLQKTKKLLILLPLIAYLFIILLHITPYYLDYFNELVGGTKTVYEKRYFLLGWWHQGIKEAGLYVQKHAPPGSTIGVLKYEIAHVPPLSKQKVILYNDSQLYDYVIVGYFSVLREGFDDTTVRKKYHRVYSVMADGARLVDIYKLAP